MDNVKNTLLEPVVSNNPIALQILGICSQRPASVVFAKARYV